MAEATGNFMHRILVVGFLEGGLAAVMTGQAKGRSSLHQEVFFIRAVSEVANQTPFRLDDCMDDLLLEVFFPVALVTGFTSFELEKVIGLGGMGVMADDAFSLLKDGMNVRFIHADLFFAMAGITDFISFFLQKELGDKTVAQVAGFTFLLFDDAVDILHGKVSVRELLVAIQAFSLGKPGLCALRFRAGHE